MLNHDHLDKKVFVVLDTNFLGHTARLDFQKFISLIQIVEKAGGNICIPKPVLEEARLKYIERVTEVKKKVEAIYKNLKRELIPGKIEIEPQQSIQEYQENLDIFLKEKKILTLDYCKNLPSIEELFKLAAAKLPPFDSKGASFRDALIWYSILEFANNNTESIVAFVTEDMDFIERCSKIAPKNLIILQHDGLVSVLETHIESKENERQQLLKNSLLSALGKVERDIVASFIRENFNFDISVGSGDELVSLDSFDLQAFTEVGNVSELENKMFGFSVKAKGNVDFKVKTIVGKRDSLARALQKLMETPKKIGDSRKVYAYDESSPWGYMPTIEEQKRVLLIGVDCFARIHEGKMSDFKPVQIETSEDITDEEFIRERILRKMALEGDKQ